LSPKPHHALALQTIAPLIHEIRGERVILDSDLAQTYGVDTRSLVQAVKRKAISSIIATIRQLTAPAAQRSRAIGFRAKRDGQDENRPKQRARVSKEVMTSN